MLRRRDLLVSAAQVAHYYPAYDFDKALALSDTKRTFLLSVVGLERDRQFALLERILGTSWDAKDLLALGKKKTQADGSTKIPSRIKLPLVAALAPDMLFKQAEAFRSLLTSADAQYIEPGSTVSEVGQWATADAQAFWDEMQGITANESK